MNPAITNTSAQTEQRTMTVPLSARPMFYRLQGQR
jgi:hypothetical protein